MNGRGEVVDADAVEEEEIQLALGAPVGAEAELRFETELKTQI